MGRVAIVGPGALGCVYGARLAQLAGGDVSMVGRTAAPEQRVVLQRADRDERIEWVRPPIVDHVPEGTDVVLVAVRYDQLPTVPARIGAVRSTTIVLTPMMPADRERLASAVPGRVLAAMPNVVAYRRPSDGVVRHWIPRVASTLLERGADGTREADLAADLLRGGIDAKVETNVLARNVATTVTFFPLMLAIGVASSLRGALEDKALLALALRGVEEGRALAEAVGEPPAWAGIVARFATPLAVRLGVGLMRARAPEVGDYLDEHFGRKLARQHVALADSVMALAREKGVSVEAVRTLAARLSREA